MERDAEHLKLLSIFYYVRGGLCAFFSCFFLIYMVMGVVFTTAAVASHGNNAPPAALGLVFAVFGGIAVIFGWIWAALQLYAGRCLGQRKHRVYCLVIAGISCLFLPYGTLLGVFTFIVLQRPSAAQLFE